MTTDEPQTRLATWIRERRRRKGPNVRQVYTRKNVVDLAGWRWARAAQQAEIASDKYRLARAQLVESEDNFLALLRPEIDLVAAAVLERLGHREKAKKARADSRKTPSKRAKKS